MNPHFTSMRIIRYIIILFKNNLYKKIRMTREDLFDHTTIDNIHDLFSNTIFTA